MEHPKLILDRTAPTLFVDYDRTLHSGHAVLNAEGQVSLESGRSLLAQGRHAFFSDHEVGEVDAVAVLTERWARERLTEKGRLYECLYPGEPREELQTESENIAVDSVAVVVLAGDAAFLNSRRFT